MGDHRGRGLAVVKRPGRGDVHWVALDPSVDTDIRKTRPAVVMSNDTCNRFGTRVVVVPITSNTDTLYPGEALVRLRGTPARVLGDQIRSIDRRRVRGRMTRLGAAEFEAVEEAVQVTLDLTR